MKYLLYIPIAFGLVGLGWLSHTPRLPIPKHASAWKDLRGIVVKVHRGDLIEVTDGKSAPVQVSLLWLDAPELDQPHGDEARAYLDTRLRGHAVQVLWTEKDEYDRLKGWVIESDLRWDVNRELLLGGSAWLTDPSQPEMSRMQEIAKKTRSGLWGDPKAISPGDWRRGMRPIAEREDE